MTYSIFNQTPNDAMKEPMFFGQPVNIARYDQQKHPIFEQLIEKQLSFFWRPEEVDVSKDRMDFGNLSSHEQHIFLSNLKYQTLLDSIQGRSPNIVLLPLVSIPELETWIETWSFSETIHSRSYTHIIRNIVNDPSLVFDDIMHNKHILERASDIAQYYDELYRNSQLYSLYGAGTHNINGETVTVDLRSLKKQLYLCIMAVNVLEAIRHVGKRLLAGFAFGGLLLLITSNVVTLIMQVSSALIPAGALTGILGAPLIIWIIFRQKRQHVDEATPNLHIERRPFTPWEWISWGALVMALLLMALFATNTISGWQFMSSDATTFDLINQFRLPRTLSAAATGVMLASAGVLIQTLTRNPMASPEVLGVSSGSAVGVLLSVVLLTMLGLPITLGSMLVSGTLGVLAVLLVILWLARTLNPAHLLLVGIAISALMNGILSVIKLSGDPRLQAILSWLSGTTYSAKPETVWWLMGTALLLSIACLLLIQPLRVLSLGGTVAKSLGLNLRLSQLAIMTVVAGLSAASTLAVGPLSFIGLMVPHLATSLGAVELNRQLPLAMLLGAGLMIIADWLGRYVIFPYEIPAGTIASIIGGAYFLFLMRKLKA